MVTKKKSQVKKPLETSDVLEALMRSMSELYGLDPSHPGITCSYLPDVKVYYCSIIRYNEKFGEGKQVIASAEALTLRDALGILVDKWRKGTVHSRKLKTVSRSFDHVFNENDDS